MKVLTLALITFLSPFAHAEKFHINCVFTNDFGTEEQMVWSLDTDRKLFAFTYMGRAPLNKIFIELPGSGFGFDHSTVEIERLAGGITVLKVNLLAGHSFAPVFVASGEMTLEQIGNLASHHHLKGVEVFYNGSESYYEHLRDFKGSVCNIVPQAPD